MATCRAARLAAGGETTSRRHGDASRRARTGGLPRPKAAPTGGTPVPAREPPDAQKLLVIIISDIDADSLIRAMVQRGHAATKIGSTGGFLRRGNTTLLVGVPAADVDDVLTLVAQTCPARGELLTLGALPLAGETPFLSEPVEVRVGGAVAFVLNVERFERV